MAIYLKFPKITGNVSELHHKGWMACQSIDFAANRQATTKMGQGKQRQGSVVSLSEISLKKQMCPGSPHLFTASVGGEGEKVEIHLTRGVTHGTHKYLEVTLHDCCVTKYELSTDGVHYFEEISLNFLKIELKFIPVKEDGKPGDAIPVHFDIATNAA
jgi:type VI secretion system secreted protein Hcp